MGFESFSNQVEDDGTPTKALDIAGQGLRDFNHRSAANMALDSHGWRYAPDAYSALRELTNLAAALPQALQQIIAALRHEADCNLIKIDEGSKFDGDPQAAVEAASVALGSATQAAQQMYWSVAEAQGDIASAAYAGPDSDDEGD
jgi:hypothetical protein